MPLVRRASVVAVRRHAPARWLGVELGEPEIVVRTRARAGSSRSSAVIRCALPGIARLLRIRLDPEARLQLDEAGRHAYVTWIEALAAGPGRAGGRGHSTGRIRRRASSRRRSPRADRRAPLLLVATLGQDPGSEGWRFRTSLPTSPTAQPRSPRAALPGGGEGDPRDAAPRLPRRRPWREARRAGRGNPLYLEELLRSLAEAGGLETRHRTWTTTLKPSLLLPPALESLLVARIDRLADGHAGWRRSPPCSGTSSRSRS